MSYRIPWHVISPLLLLAALGGWLLIDREQAAPARSHERETVPIDEVPDSRNQRAVSVQTRLARDIREMLSNDAAQFDIHNYLAKLAALTRMKPTAATSIVARLKAGSVRDQSIRFMMETWAATDTRKALEWASSLEDQAEREFAVGEGFREIGRNDPRLALEWLDAGEFPAGPGAGMELIRSWASTDPQAAISWLESHPSPDLQRDSRWSALASVLAETSPTVAAAIVSERIRLENIQTEAAIAVLHQWALRDADGAVAWVAQFPEGQLRSRAEAELSGILGHSSGADAGMD